MCQSTKNRQLPLRGPPAALRILGGGLNACLLGESLVSEGLESAVPVVVASIMRLDGRGLAPRDQLIPFFGIAMAMLTGAIFEHAHSAPVGISKSFLVAINTIGGSNFIIHGGRELLTHGTISPERTTQGLALIMANVLLLLGAHAWEEHQTADE